MAKHFVTEITDERFTYRRNEAKVAAEQQRTSIVAPARHSKAAVAKARRKRTDDDLPVHSFRTLLTDLGTLATNTMQVADSEATFTLQTQPTLLQQRCLELLGVTPRM